VDITNNEGKDVLSKFVEYQFAGPVAAVVPTYSAGTIIRAATSVGAWGGAAAALIVALLGGNIGARSPPPNEVQMGRVQQSVAALIQQAPVAVVADALDDTHMFTYAPLAEEAPVPAEVPIIGSQYIELDPTKVEDKVKEFSGNTGATIGNSCGPLSLVLLQELGVPIQPDTHGNLPVANDFWLLNTNTPLPDKQSENDPSQWTSTRGQCGDNCGLRSEYRVGFYARWSNGIVCV